MPRTVSALLVALLLVVAGCSGGSGSTATAGSATTSSPESLPESVIGPAAAVDHAQQLRDYDADTATAKLYATDDGVLRPVGGASAAADPPETVAETAVPATEEYVWVVSIDEVAGAGPATVVVGGETGAVIAHYVVNGDGGPAPDPIRTPNRGTPSDRDRSE